MTEAKSIKCAVALIAASLCAGQVWAQTASSNSGQQARHAPQVTDTLNQLSLQMAQMKGQLADWANLHRYREENSILPPVPKGTQRIVFYGDSITDFWGRKAGSFFPGKPYVNRGIWGQTTPQMLVRFQQDVVHLHPAIVVVLAGTNDIAGNTGQSTPQMIEDNFVAMAAIAEHSGIKMVFASILPADHYWWNPKVHPVETIRTVNQWLKNFCSQNGLVYLDYYDSMADSKGGMREGLSSDGVHPTAQGYDVMATLAEQAIMSASK